MSYDMICFRTELLKVEGSY